MKAAALLFIGIVTGWVLRSLRAQPVPWVLVPVQSCECEICGAAAAIQRTVMSDEGPLVRVNVVRLCAGCAADDIAMSDYGE